MFVHRRETLEVAGGFWQRLMGLLVNDHHKVTEFECIPWKQGIYTD